MELLIDNPKGKTTFIMAHGAGAFMDSKFMNEFAQAIAEQGNIKVVRFEFPYMQERRKTQRKRPPNAMKILVKTFYDVLRKLDEPYENIVVGGKSMGGRVASILSQELEDKGMNFKGVCVFGYPFHAIGKQITFPTPDDDKRVGSLIRNQTPMLICQGSRDNFGWFDEVDTYPLSDKIQYTWLDDGDHDFRPRVLSGLTQPQNWHTAQQSAIDFINNL